jgi:DNA-binding GntR family transcriptional regulator
LFFNFLGQNWQEMKTSKKLETDGLVPRSLIESTYLKLRLDIIECRLQPDEKLRVAHLKDDYGVGAGTVREAFGLLLADSLVVSEAQKGFRVAAMSLNDIEDLTRTRTLLECAALRDSIELGDDNWLNRVENAYEQLAKAEEGLTKQASDWFNDWEVCNRKFHLELTSACPSQWIQRFQKTLYQQAERYRRLSATTTKVPKSVHDEHRKIYEAVMRRDVEMAHKQLEKHIQFALREIKKGKFLK